MIKRYIPNCPIVFGKELKIEMSSSNPLRKKELEIWLQQVPLPEKPIPELEQYTTPATIAADILFTAYSLDDIYKKEVVDLGCGTGIFTLGAAYAGAKKAMGFDVDEDSIYKAKKAAKSLGVSDWCSFTVSPVESVDIKGDTVIMNPPFGSQKKGADLPFLDTAFRVAPRIYSIHNARSEDFIRRYINQHGYHVFGEKRYMFPVNRLFGFHKKDRKVFETVLFMFERN